MWLAFVVALLGFICLGVISGRVEQGALVQANQWRECIVMLQSGNEFEVGELKDKILDVQRWQATTVYIIAYVALIGTFISIVYLALHLIHRAG